MVTADCSSSTNSLFAELGLSALRTVQPHPLSLQLPQLLPQGQEEASQDDQAGLDGAAGELSSTESVQTAGSGGPGLLQHRQVGLQRGRGHSLCQSGEGVFTLILLKVLQAMKILSKKKLQKKAGIFGRIAPTRKGPGGRLIKKAENPLDKVKTFLI